MGRITFRNNFHCPNENFLNFFSSPTTLYILLCYYLLYRCFRGIRKNINIPVTYVVCVSSKDKIPPIKEHKL